MEPMALGSPSSPSPGSTYLPSFLMGESNTSTAPRSNTLSPSKGRALAFASQATPVTSPGDLNRSILQQKTLFGYQQTPPSAQFGNVSQLSHNTSVSGPPTQGLFDSLRIEKNAVAENVSFSQKGRQLNQTSFNQSINDSFQSDFNTSRITSPNGFQDFRTPNTCLSPTGKSSNFWVTIYGFPQTATSMILSHFSQCGTIVEKIFPPQSGNWVHLRFASGMECDKALNYHERIIANSIMIGVTYCKDPAIVDKENLDRSHLPINRVRPLAQIAYKNAQSPAEVMASPTTPRRSSGIVNKAMDMFFGW